MTVVTDDFNRADDASLGAAWTELAGDWQVASNAAQNDTDDGPTGYYARHDTTVGSSDMFAEATVLSSQSNGGSNTGVLVRGQTGATNTSYQFVTNHGTDLVGFWRIVAGTETQLRLAGNATGASAPTTMTVALASGDVIRCDVAGNLLRGSVNGTLVALARDTTTGAGTRGGLNGYNNDAADSVRLDAFRAGALADDPPAGPYVVGLSAQAAGTATTLTPTVPSSATGRCVVALVTGRDAAQTVTAPAGEGWSLVENPSQTGLETWVFAKIWGTGATDDTTPTFTIGSGTAGWGVTVVTLANPSHATSPWTTVTEAIVASGSQSNASSTTVTAPSVTSTGANRTSLRLFSSADDNALGVSATALTNSEGAVICGGADFDSTQGNDFGQCVTILEDTTHGGSTGTATVTETAVGPDISNGVTLVVAVPGGTNGSAAPSAIAATVTVSRPGTDTGTSPPAVTATTILPASTVVGVTRVQPETVASTLDVPAPAASGATAATPPALPATADLPAPITSGDVGVTPASIAATLTILPAGGSATTTPATIVATVSLPAPSLPVPATVEPPTITMQADVPVPDLSSGVSPATNVAAVAVPTPSVSAGGSISVSPATIQALVDLLTPDLSAGTGPATVAAQGSLPSPTASGGTAAAASPATIVALLVPLEPNVTGSTPGTATPATVALVAVLPPATASGTASEIVGRVVFVSIARSSDAIVTARPATTATHAHPLVDMEVTTS